MKKILFISTYGISLYDSNLDVPFGGAEIQFYMLSNKLKKKGYSVFIFTGDFGQENFTTKEGVNVIKTFKLKGIFNKLFAPFKLFKSLYKLQPSFIFCRANGMELGVAGFYRFFFKVNLIYMGAHDFDSTGEHFKGLVGAFFKFGLAKSDLITAQNSFQKDNFSKFFPGKKIILFNNLFEMRLPSKSTRDYILWVGRADVKKRPEIFLDVVKKFPEEKFMMIMPKSSNEKYYYSIRKEALSLNNLQFVERVNFSKIQKYFDKSKLFLCTSSSEGFPNTYIQSGISSTPIVSLSLDPNFVFRDYSIGFNAKGSWSLFLDKIYLLLNDSLLWEKYSKNAYTYVRNNHDVEEGISILEDELLK